MPQNLRKSGNIPLTKRVVDASLPREKRYHLWDSELRGFGLRVEPRGIKTFLTKYRAERGGGRAQERRITHGRYGAFTPGEARRKSRKVLLGPATGDDQTAAPQDKPKEKRIS